jgi:hypothetical protein
VTQNFDAKFTVGTYSDGNLLVVYEIRRQVFPTAPSPTTTHLIVCMVCQKILAALKIIANSILALKKLLIFSSSVRGPEFCFDEIVHFHLFN